MTVGAFGMTAGGGFGVGSAHAAGAFGVQWGWRRGSLDSQIIRKETDSFYHHIELVSQEAGQC